MTSNDYVNKLYNELGNQLRAFIYKHIKNDHDTDDIFQDVFIKIHNKIVSLKDRDKLNSWVYQITRNTIIDFKRKKQSDDLIGEIPDLGSIGNESDEMLSQGLLIIINTLPQIYKDVLILSIYENLKYSEISERLNIVVSTVKTRIFRARKLFRDKILEFCHFELDRYGSIVNYEPNECFICHIKEMYKKV